MQKRDIEPTAPPATQHKLPNYDDCWAPLYPPFPLQLQPPAPPPLPPAVPLSPRSLSLPPPPPAATPPPQQTLQQTSPASAHVAGVTPVARTLT